MLPVLALAAVALAAPRSEPPAPVASITLAGRALRASQIAVVPPERDTIVARLPENADTVILEEADRVAMLRNRYPGERFRLRQTGPLRLVRQPAGGSGGLAAGCRLVMAPISAGAYLDETDLAPAACPGSLSGGWLTYDAASGAYFARQDIPAGINLGRITAKARPAALAGAEVTYRTSEGPVVVECKAIALQSARDGRRLFVRTEDGRVLSARLQAAAP